MSTLDRVVEEAMSWRGTPYVWRCAVKGLGADCGTFVWHCYNRFYVMPHLPENYYEAWMCEQGPSYALDIADPICERLVAPERPGDYLAFKFGHHFIHSAIYLGDRQMIHCYGRKGRAGVCIQPIEAMRGREMIVMRPKPEFERPV